MNVLCNTCHKIDNQTDETEKKADTVAETRGLPLLEPTLPGRATMCVVGCGNERKKRIHEQA